MIPMPFDDFTTQIQCEEVYNEEMYEVFEVVKSLLTLKQ